MSALRKASRKRVKIKMQIGGTSGSGKTYGALKLAYGITNNWDKIAVIDTENGSSELYVGKDGIGEFLIYPLSRFTEKHFIQALDECEKAGIEVCIIDSSTRLWDYILELQANLGGTYKDWKEPKQKHKQYLYRMLQSEMHIISTVRKKEEYVIEENDKGKKNIKKVGLKEQQEGNMNYEFTLVFDVDRDNHLTIASKDRTGLFSDNVPFLITEEVGAKIKEWCESGTVDERELLFKDAVSEITGAGTIEELKEIWQKYPTLHTYKDFADFVTNKKTEMTSTK